MRKLMERKKAEIMSLEEAVKEFIYDGVSCGFSGFTAFNRNPVAFAWEMVRQGIKEIHVIDRHGSFCTWLLNAVNAIKIYETDWMGWAETFGKLDLNLDRNYKAGKIILEDYSHGAMAMRFLAGAMGIPFIPYYAPRGSDLYNLKYDALGMAGLRDGSNPRIPKKKFVEIEDPFYGEGKLVLLPAARPEVAIIHVPKVGERGTAAWRGISTIDKELAFAADKVIITAEEIVPEPEMRRFPEANQIPFFVVDAIVEVPWGAYPTAVPYYYDYDAEFMKRGATAQRSEESMKEWLDEWVFSPKNWEDFINKVGAERLNALRASSTTGYSTRLLRGKKQPPRMNEPLSVKLGGW